MGGFQMSNDQNRAATIFKISTIVLIVIELSNLFFGVSQFFLNFNDTAKIKSQIEAFPELEASGRQIDPEFIRSAMIIVGVLVALFGLLFLFLLVRKLIKYSSGKFITRGIYVFLGASALLSLIATRNNIQININFFTTLMTLIASIAAIVTATTLNQDRSKRPERDYQPIPKANMTVTDTGNNGDSNYQYYNPAYRDANENKKYDKVQNADKIDMDNYRN